MNDRILLATGGDPGVEQAIVHAIDLADVYDGTLYALYVVDEAIYELFEDEADTEETPRETLEARGTEALDAVAERADDAEVPFERTMRYGQPAAEIVAAAEEIDADTIILGSRTMPEEYRTRVGSVADEVVRQTDRSVTVVKTPVPEE